MWRRRWVGLARWGGAVRCVGEDRSGGRAWEACKRARQESVHLLSSPSGFRPMPTVGLATRPKRRPPGGPASRGAKLARRAE